MNSNVEIMSLVTWLIAGAPPPSSFDSFIEAFSKRLVSAGFPIESIALYKYNIHPIFPADIVLWTTKNGVRQITVPSELVKGAEFQSYPQARTIRDQRALRYRFTEGEADHNDPTIKRYRDSGYTDLLCLPLFNVDGSVTRCAFYGTTSKEGFSEDLVKQLRRLQAPFARVCEHYGGRNDMKVSLTTYLGEKIGQKVLDGKIQRGDGETIAAVILFVDLVGYTAMSNTVSGTRVLEILNNFYETINTSVVANYGEILKFVGDGALVVFPVVDDLTAQEAASQNALNAVVRSRIELQKNQGDMVLEFRAALHIGEVFYGNIGSKDRLDFTAVGPAVNLASRLLDQASILDAKTVCSEEFNAIANIATGNGTRCDLKGFDKAVSVFVVE